MSIIQTRRRFISTLASTGLAGLTPTLRALAAEGPIEPPPETTTVRLARDPTICFAPLYVCEDLLRAEGFTDIRCVDIEIRLLAGSEEVGHGRVDFASLLTLNHIVAIDAGAPITIVTGVHAGCYELFAHDGIRAITDRGRRSRLRARRDIRGSCANARRITGGQDRAAVDACGRVPVRGLLTAAKRPGMSIIRLDLRNSGDTAGPRDRVVGYGSWALFEPALVEEIITALSRITWLFVIARNSTFTYKGQAVDVKRVGRELGVRYVATGEALDRLRAAGSGQPPNTAYGGAFQPPFPPPETLTRSRAKNQDGAARRKVIPPHPSVACNAGLPLSVNRLP